MADRMSNFVTTDPPPLLPVVLNEGTEPDSRVKEALHDLRIHTSGSVNVKSFGAVGDRMTDDTDAIQAALDASKHVFFPPGHYIVSRPLTAQGSSVIRGAGRNATFIDAYFYSGPNFGAPALTFAAGEHPVLSDLMIHGHGNDPGGVAASGVLFAGGYFPFVQNCAFAGIRGNGSTQGYGIRLMEAASALITSNELLEGNVSTDVGILLSGGSGTVILRNQFATHGYDIATDPATVSGAVIIGNTFDPSAEGAGAYDRTEVGILVHRGQGNFFIDRNYFEGSGPHPIQPFNIGSNGSSGVISTIAITGSNVASGVTASTRQSVLDNIGVLDFSSNAIGQPTGVSFGSGIALMHESTNTYNGSVIYSAASRFATGATGSTYPVEVVNATATTLARFFRENAGAGLQISADSDGAILETEGVQALQVYANDLLAALFDGGVKLPSLPSTNPGAGSKRLWYDPADGDRVKYAP